jgi:hypothetical protein
MDIALIALIKILTSKGPKWGLGEHWTSKYKKKQGCQTYEARSVYWLNSYETNSYKYCKKG